MIQDVLTEGLTFDAQGHATVNNFGAENNGGMVQVPVSYTHLTLPTKA